MRAMLSRSSGSLFLGLLALVVCAAAQPANAQRASSYQNSCQGIHAEGATLVANCRRIDGSYAWTRIEIPGMENIDGRLRFNGMGQPSSFQNSCSLISVSANLLRANCRRVDGSYNETSIYIPGIANIDGVLRYQ